MDVGRTTAQRNKIVKDTLLLNVASAVSQVTSVVQSFLIMRVLVPGALGVWLGFGVALGYSAYIHLGLDYGMGMRLPYYRGRGDSRKEGECEDSTYVTWTGLALLFSVGMVTYALSHFRTNPTLAWTLFVVAMMAPLEQQSGFLGRWQTAARSDFRLPSIMGVGRAVAAVLILVPTAYFFGAKGMMLGSLSLSLVMCVTWWSMTTFRYRARVSMRAALDIIAVGMPVLLISLAATLIQTIDRLIIASRLGATSLGYYGATSLGGALLLGVLSQSGSAMAPHLSEELGRSDGKASALERFLVKPTIINAFVGAAGVMVLMFVVPAFIRVLLPRYVPGIPAFYAFVPGFFFLVLVNSSHNILANVLIAGSPRKIVVMAGFQAVALLVEIGCALLFIRLDWGITGVAVASTLSYAVYGGCILGATTWYVVRDPAQRLVFFFHVMVPFFYCGLATGASMWVGRALAGNAMAQAAIGLVTSLVLLVPLTLWLEARIGVMRDLRGIVEGLRARYLGAAAVPNVG